MARAVLFNSTSTYMHLGCFLTMCGLRALLLRSGFHVIYEVPVNSPLGPLAARLNDLPQDVVFIINGEGTLHHNQTYAIELLDFISASTRKFFILNSCFEAMSEEYIKKAIRAEVFQVRNTFDADALKEHRSDILFAPDMVFFSRWDRVVASCDFVGFSDSSLQSSTKMLRRIFREYDGKKRWLNIHYQTAGVLRSRMVRYRNAFDQLVKVARPDDLSAIGREGITTLHETALSWQSAKGLITGRYHACCLALLWELPSLFLPGNSAKIEKFYSDVGWECRFDADLSVAKNFEKWSQRNELTKKRSQYLASAETEFANLIEGIKCS